MDSGALQPGHDRYGRATVARDADRPPAGLRGFGDPVGEGTVHAQGAGHLAVALQRGFVYGPVVPRQVEERRVMPVQEVRREYVLVTHGHTCIDGGLFGPQVKSSQRSCSSGIQQVSVTVSRSKNW